MHNNNIWISYGGSNRITKQYYYDGVAGTCTFVQEIYAGLGTLSTSLKHCNVSDFTYDSLNNVYLYTRFKLSTDTDYVARIRKMSLDSNGIYQFSGSPLLVPNVRSDYTGAVPRYPSLIMSFGCNYILYIKSDGTLKYGVVDTSNMTLQEFDVQFNDNLDTTKITNFALAKGSGFLFVLSSDTDLAENERARLYSYNNGVYEFIGCPESYFNPITKSNTLPNVYAYELLNSIRTPYTNASGFLTIYNVSKELINYEYSATKCNNHLASVTGATAYGVVKENIAQDDVGKGSILFKK